MNQPIEQQKIETDSRAKEIDHGTIPVPMTNAILGLPTKPGNQFDDRSSISAIKWTFDQLVGQKQLIDVLKVTKTTDTTRPVFLFRNSWQQINRTFFNSLAKLFYFKSFKLNFLFQFRSNFQQVGMMAVSFVNYPLDSIPYFFDSKSVKPYNADADALFYPKIVNNYEPGLIDSLKAIYQLPHTLVFMGEDQDVPITLNWLSPFKAGFSNDIKFVNQTSVNYFNDDYDMGFIRLHVPIKMTTAAGVQDTLTVRIYGWISDLEYSGYVPTDDL